MTYVIAELGINHNGNYNNAINLIKVAKKAGANAVKLQTFEPEEIMIKSLGMAPYQKNNDKKMHFLSTEAMINRAKETASKNIIVATETGVIHKLKKNSPDKNFIPINKSATCKYMKMITVDKVLETLKSESPEVKVEKYIAAKAKTAIDRMVGLV